MNAPRDLDPPGLRWVLPPPVLSSWVDRFWSLRIPPGTPDREVSIPPDNCQDVLCLPSGALMLCGVQTGPLRVLLRGGDRFWGVRFRPGAWSGLFREDGERTRDRSVPAEDTWGGWNLLGDLTEGEECPDPRRIWDLLSLRARGEEPDRWGDLLESLRREGRVWGVGTLAAVSGVHPRTLERRFRIRVGVSPKRFLRVERVRYAAVLLRRGWSPTGAALEAGYADGAHLARECRALLDASPGAFRPPVAFLQDGPERDR